MAEADGEPRAVPDAYWSVRPLPPSAGPTTQEKPEPERLQLRGAVLVRCRGRRAAVDPSRLSPELAAAVTEPPSRPGRTLWGLVRSSGRAALATLGGLLVLATGGVVFEALLFRGFFDVGSELGLTAQRVAGIGALVAFLAGLLLLEWPVARGVLRLGRQLETRLRVAFLSKVPKLGDRYFRSRLTSDLASRCHNVHRLRLLPALGEGVGRTVFELLLTTAAIVWLDPGSLWLALTAAAVALVLPLLALPWLTERDLREREHAGALSRFYLDALLGLVPLRTHGAQRAVEREHESLLVEWVSARLGREKMIVGLDLVLHPLLLGLVGWLLVDHLGRRDLTSGVLLLVFWSLNLFNLGRLSALLIAHQYPSHRSIALRLLEPLGAPDEVEVALAERLPESTAPVAVELERVAVRVAGHGILESVDLRIAAGEHLAIVGPSGAGKSSLVGLFLGWFRPAAGRLLVDGRPLTPDRLAALRRATAWVDPQVQLWNRSLLDNLLYGSGEGAAEVGQVAATGRAAGPAPGAARRTADDAGRKRRPGVRRRGPAGAARPGDAAPRRAAGDPRRAVPRPGPRPAPRAAGARPPAVGRRHAAGGDPRHRGNALLRPRAGDREPPPDRGRSANRAGRAPRLGLSPPAARRARRAPGAVGRSRLAPAAGRRRPHSGDTAGDTAGRAARRRMRPLADLAWPAAELHRALDGAARAHRYASGGRELAPPPPGLDPAETGEWLEAAAQWLGLEAEPVQVEYVDLERFLRRAAPAILRLPGAGGEHEETRYLVVIASGRRLELLTPDQRRHRLPVGRVRDALGAQLEEPLAGQIDALLDEAGVKPRRRDAARGAILRARLQRARIGGCWLLRLPAGSSFWRQLRDQKVPRLAATALGTHLVQQLLLIGSWWMLGHGVLGGRVDRGWLLAWALLLVSITPFRASELWSLGVLTTRVGALLKRRLLAGTLRLEPEETRHQGVGQFLGRVIDAEAVETLVLSGGHLGLIALLQLALALPILALGAGGAWLAPMLVAWTALAAWFGRRYYKQRRRWTRERLDVTHDLVESLVGHRTRLAQQRPEVWHETEDRQLADYLESSRGMDRDAARLRALIPRGWLLLGILGLAPAFIGGGASVAKLAVGVGGVLFSYQALWKLSRGLSDLAQAMIAWRQVEPLFNAAAREEAAMPPELAGEPARLAGGRRAAGQPLIEARELSFGYPGRARQVLTSCDLEIAAGDRLLVEGPSGSGKSTLAALVGGLRKPVSGLLLLDGFDRGSLGARGWRRRVAAAPQFHENWVLSETLMFNLLMGRGWPPTLEDQEAAEEVCRALGLGDLLDRMPSGLQQIVGESGWHLSHGEQSRVFIARALLQDTELVLFDESFAALDPANLRKCLETVIARSPTLMVVAHP